MQRGDKFKCDDQKRRYTVQAADEPVEIPKHSFGGARLMTDEEREMVRCGFGQAISEADKAKIAKAFDEAKAAPHKHVWSNWLPANSGAGEFRKCIDCREIETRD